MNIRKGYLQPTDLFLSWRVPLLISLSLSVLFPLSSFVAWEHLCLFLWWACLVSAYKPCRVLLSTWRFLLLSIHKWTLYFQKARRSMYFICNRVLHLLKTMVHGILNVLPLVMIYGLGLYNLLFVVFSLTNLSNNHRKQRNTLCLVNFVLHLYLSVWKVDTCRDICHQLPLWLQGQVGGQKNFWRCNRRRRRCRLSLIILKACDMSMV